MDGWKNGRRDNYNVKQLKVSGESGDVNGGTVDAWKERLPELASPGVL